MRKRGALLVAALAMLFVGATARPASATVYNLTSDHCSGGCGPAGTIFGTVTLLQNGTTVDVTVHLNAPYAFAKTGAVDSQAFLFSGTGVVLGDITVNAHTPALAVTLGPYTASGIGSFAFGIGCPGCGGGLSDAFTNDIVFHVANAVIADLEGFPGGFAADIGNLTTGNTGPIDASICTTQDCTRDIPQTPEPTTLLLMGTGLLLATRGLRKLRG